ncbi:hypothetical protein LSAT2_004246, partial [Lamellibrachia satsuma]
LTSYALTPWCEFLAYVGEAEAMDSAAKIEITLPPPDAAEPTMSSGGVRVTGGCRYVLLGGALCLVMAVVMVTFILVETPTSFSWIMCVIVMGDGVIVFVGVKRWWKSRDPGMSKRKHDRGSYSKKESW